MSNFKRHFPFLIILLLHLALLSAYASLVPLGEAPDEPAHLTYARFIAENGRLPVTLDERRAASYRSAWPPLYHFLVTGPLNMVGDTPPTRLKSVGDTPRRLISTDGQTIASFIHTDDEAWPWRGITLAWHIGRFVSVILTALAVTVTYVIAWRLTGQRWLATGAAALHAFIPQALFTGSVVSDDNLLILLSGLVLLTLVDYTQRPPFPGPGRFLFLGALLGLATVTKYNALPLWALTMVWMIWLTYKFVSLVVPHRDAGPTKRNLLLYRVVSPAEASPPGTVGSLIRLLALFAGAALTSGWWFSFVWRNFNQVGSQGLIRGSLTALSAGTADASLRQLSSDGSLSLPPLTAWLEWIATFFQSFWGLFGGGSTIDLPGWIYWLLAAICALAISSLLAACRAQHPTPHLPISPSPHLFLLSPLFFLPLPLLRFLLSGGNVVETAQGRHLFPALPAIALGLVLGLSYLGYRVSGFTSHVAKNTQVKRFTFHVSRFTPLLYLVLPILASVLSLYSLNLIRSSYPPLIPLRTTADAAAVENQVQANPAGGITLIGYELGQPENGVLPITLVWQASSTPPEDYLIELTITDSTGQVIGGWLGHPTGGRYPTRAWEKGDIVRDTIPIPLLPGLPTTEARLTLHLLESTTDQTTTPITLAPNMSLPPTPQLPISPSSHLPSHLRADGLPPGADFSYRSTLSFILPERVPMPELTAPDGQTFPADRFFSGSTGSIAHFIVAAHWPGGPYQLAIIDEQLTIVNRPRQFDLPAREHSLQANFADHITLLGYDLPQRRVQAGESFPVTLHLRAERTMGENLVIFNHLLDQTAIQHGGADRIPQNYYTTLLWVPGEIVSDSYEVPVDTTAPPGIYQLDVGFYPDTKPTFSLPLFVDGQPIDRNSVTLGPLKIGGPPPATTLPEAQPQRPLNISFDNQITLLGFNLTDISGNPIQPETHNPKLETLTLFWQPTTIPQTDYTVFVHLLDPQGNLIAQADSPPAAGAYPTSLWDPGEIIVDEHLLPELSPGRYGMQVGLYRPDTGERLPVAGTPDGTVKLIDFEIAP